MKQFDLKKYLTENKLTKTSLLRENEASIPEGWSESVIGPKDQDPELYGGELVKSYTAPMEGWDNEHLDIVNIIKKEDGTYSIDVYVAFGDHIEDENTSPYPTYEAAHARAVEIMEEFKDDWEDKGEEDGLDENKENNNSVLEDYLLHLFGFIDLGDNYTPGPQEFKFERMEFGDEDNYDDADLFGQAYNYIEEKGGSIIINSPYNDERLKFSTDEDNILVNWDSE